MEKTTRPGKTHQRSGDLSCIPSSSSHPIGPCPHRFNWKAGAPLDWGIPGRGPPRGSSWSGVGVGESPKAPSTVTPAGDRSVSGCWLSSCLRAPCCPEGLRRFWLRSQLVHRKKRGLFTHWSALYLRPAPLVNPAAPSFSGTSNFSTVRRLSSEIMHPSNYSFCFPLNHLWRATGLVPPPRQCKAPSSCPLPH